MTKYKHNLTTALGIVVVVLVIVFGFQYLAPYVHFTSPAPTQAEWDKALGASTNKTLFGRLLSHNTDSIVLFAQEAGLGTTTVALTASTTIVRDTPLSPEAMQAAYQEYKKLEAQSGGKPFQGPETMKVETVSLGDLAAGDLLLVTLTTSSTKGHFTAERIELVPVNTVLPAVPAATQGSAAPL